MYAQVDDTPFQYKNNDNPPILFELNLDGETYVCDEILVHLAVR